MTSEQRQQWIDNLRRIPMEAVLRAAGAQPSTRDPSKWRSTCGVLSVNAAKFINWNNGQSGGGAIDLVMHLNNLNFNDAVQWLAKIMPATPPPISLKPPIKPELLLPASDKNKIDPVKQYLIKQRRLPQPIVETLVHTGKLYADHKANAVFLLLGKKNHPVGAELRGTNAYAWRGLAAGSRKDKGCFFVGAKDSRQAILCESAIDAISCAAIYPDRLCISTSGARPNPVWLAPLLAQGRQVFCGFDADTTGDRMAEAMITIHHAVQRLRPPAHDWNDTIIQSA